jgi:hypothetical protein
MPFALAIIGLALIVTAIRGTTTQLFSLIKSDFTGSGNYIWWIVSLLVIGAFGYIKRIQPVVNMFIVLVLVVMFIGAGKKGFFAQFTDAIRNPATNCGGPQATGVKASDITTAPVGSTLPNGNVVVAQGGSLLGTVTQSPTPFATDWGNIQNGLNYFFGK